MSLILALIGIPLFIGLGLFFTGSLTFAAISAVFSMATVAFVPIISLIFVLWLITGSVILSILFTLIFGLIVLAANNTKQIFNYIGYIDNCAKTKSSITSKSLWLKPNNSRCAYRTLKSFVFEGLLINRIDALWRSLHLTH